MSNVVIHRNGGQGTPSVGGAGLEWEPGRLMRDVMGWDPFREMAPLWASERPTGYVPAFEVKETKEGFSFRADLPGIKEQDLDIQLAGNRLTVSGKREAEQHEKTDTYFVFERGYGTFTRAFTLPDGVDAAHVHAELRDGVLQLMLPKRPEIMPKRIAIHVGKSKS